MGKYCEITGRLPKGVSYVFRCTMFQQKLNHRAMALLYGLMQRCVVEFPFGVNRSTASNQCFNFLQISSNACYVKRTVSKVAYLIHIIEMNLTEFREFFILKRRKTSDAVSVIRQLSLNDGRGGTPKLIGARTSHWTGLQGRAAFA